MYFNREDGVQTIQDAAIGVVLLHNGKACEILKSIKYGIVPVQRERRKLHYCSQSISGEQD